MGGGFSGVLQAINLLRHGGPKVTLIERRAEPGVGLAYGEAAAEHLLNVRAKGMSAFPDRPDDFVHWLAGQGLDFGPDTFVPRLVYGRYLKELLARAVADDPDRLTVVSGNAVAVRSGDSVAVYMANGQVVEADCLILAVGNLPPHDPPGFRGDLDPDLYVADPWSGSGSAGLGDDYSVLLLGTGLTMVDVALRLRNDGFRG